MDGARSQRESTSWSSSSALESSERQLQLWRMILRARTVALVGLALLALLPLGGERRVLVSICLLAMIPYDEYYAHRMRRTGVLSPVMAFTDQMLVVVVSALVPYLVVPIMIVVVGMNATTAASFGRRLSFMAASLGAVGLCVVVVTSDPSNTVIASYIVVLVTSSFIMLTVGSVAETERDLRVRYAELMGGIDAVVWEQLTRRPSTLYVNRRAEEILGYPASAWAQPGFWRKIVHPDDVVAAARSYRDAIRRGTGRELEYRMVAADGRTIHVHDRMRVETDAHGRASKVRGVLLDVTERKEAEEAISQYVNLVERIQLALFVLELDDTATDEDAVRVVAINPEAALVTGTHPSTATGRPLLDVLQMPGGEHVAAALADVVRTGEGWVIEEFRIDPSKPNGRVYAAHAFPLPGRAVGFSLEDVTERAIAAEVLRRQALHDGLTGLPNRTYLTERLRHVIAEGEIAGRPVALLVMDLDQFKEVNDALGHDHGDRLLVEMSRRFEKVLRDVDTIARLGGDEFAVLLTDDVDHAQAVDVARRIRRALEQPFQLGGISLQTNASIGVALFPNHAREPETLAQRADVAMYTAKRSGGGIAVYAPEHDQSSVRRLTLLGELRRAIQDAELVLHYQPCLDLRSGTVRGVEALVRWDHPQHGLMPPSEFIELAEVSGLIQPLARWVLDRALRQTVAWRGSDLDLTVSVNLSVRNLYDADLVPWLADLLDERRIEPSSLKLEITESELMDDPLLAMEVLGRLKALGASTSIDDFGTGYSSLAYLKHLPIDELKIDRSFVATMMQDDSDLTIVRSTIDLSHNLGLLVVAEGVEDAETLEMLAELGCDCAQGFLISRPLPPAGLEAWMAAAPAWGRVARAHAERPAGEPPGEPVRR